jgi:hypothetical protein
MRTTVPCRDLRNSERSSAALPIFAGSNYRSRFDDANAVFLSGRFLCRWNELDNLPAFFTGNPILQFFGTDSDVALLLLQSPLLSFLRFTHVYRMATTSAPRALPLLRRMEFGLVKGELGRSRVVSELLF